MTTKHPRKHKFILADPSAIHTGGHHFEYAVRILLEAMDQGYEPELWAHKNAKLPDDLFEVKKCFTNSFYENMAPRKGGRFLKHFSNGKIVSILLPRIKTKLKVLLYKVMLETSLGVAISRAKHDGARDQFRPNYNAGYNDIKTSKITYTILYVLYKIYKIIHAKQKWLLLLSKVLIVIIIVLLLPILIPIAIILFLYMLFSMRKDGPELVFANDMRAQLMDRDWQEDDVIFVPTCFFVEAGAMVELLTRWMPEKVLPQLHLLFRTNVFSGYTHDYRNQLEQHLPYRAAFKWLFASDYNAQIYCYTDTPQLSQQYKVLSDEWFEPLPVPVPWDIEDQDEKSVKKPLTIAYVGDVRDEKGYQFYPQLVDHLWDDYIKTGDVKFKLQSNFADNLDVSRESAVAQSILKGYDKKYVEHVQGPLSSDGYKDLIENSDIILLTYYPPHYMARSSGIFIEAMKAGKPVIMPAKTWMADLVEDMRQDRWKEVSANLSKHANLSQTLTQDQWNECKDKNLKYIILNAEFDIPEEETGYICLSVRRLDKNKISLGVDDVTVAQINRDGTVYCMTQISGEYHHLNVQYKVLGTRAKANTLGLYTSTKPWNEARDFAAVIYPYHEQSYINKAMVELIENYDQYARQVKLFTANKGDYFTPKTLVSNIIRRAQGKGVSS